MPKIISYTPSWLSRPSPGFDVFNTAHTTSTNTGWEESGSQPVGKLGSIQDVGPNRTIARRGTEIFVAAGKQIRWTDLVSLKDDFEGQLQTPSKKPKTAGGVGRSREAEEGPEDGSYRHYQVLKVTIGRPIRQMSVSPNGDLLAIATSHTVHIAILPSSSHLGQIENGQIANKPIKLKTYTIGPTAHVLSQSRVTNILWHPCGVGGSCLVTVTADAIIRLWEIKHEDRLSFANPALAIDLKKLVNASSDQDDIAPNRFERNRGFSFDDVGLEVASACFGGSGSSQESGWSAMTLWIAMRGGDVYALCPLLPSRWESSVTLVSSLSQSALAKDALRETLEASDSAFEQQCRDQLEWLRDIDAQDPVRLESDDDFSPASEIYHRPTRPGPIPKLQGPFQMSLEDLAEDFEFSDIHIIAAKTENQELGEDDSDSEAESIDEHGLSAPVIVLLTTSGIVFLCLDLDGVEGQWLPREKPKQSLPLSAEPYLVVLEGLDTMTEHQQKGQNKQNDQKDQSDQQWPTISQDVESPYSFFITRNTGVFYFSCNPWIQSLAKELQSSEKLGAPFRFEVIKKGPGTLREKILSFDNGEDSEGSVIPSRVVSASVTFEDSDLGYFLLTSVDGHPYAVTFDLENQFYGRTLRQFYEDEDEQISQMKSLTLGPAREIYQPSDTFYVESSLPKFLERNVHARHKRTVKEDLLMSIATLDQMTQAHRILSQETYRLGLAASELFSRCKALQETYSKQINDVNELAHRTEKLSGKDADSYVEHIKRKQPPTAAERLEKVRDRQPELVERYEILRNKFSKVGGRPLSEKEQLWVSEVSKASKLIKGPKDDRRKSVTTENGDGARNDEDGEHTENGQNGEHVEHEKDGAYEEDTETPSDLWIRSDQIAKLKSQLIEHVDEITQNSHSQSDPTDSHFIPNTERQRRLEEVNQLLTNQNNLLEEAQNRLHQLTDSVAA